MASLPKWKAQLLERKRRDEEEGRRKEKEELERLASIPAWKKEVMERRRRSRLGPRAHPAPQAEEPLPAGCAEAGLREAIRNPFVRQERRRWDSGLRPPSPPPPLPLAGRQRPPLAQEPLTRSVEDLSCLGREQEVEGEEEAEEEEGEGEPRRGRVSRLLSRFGQRRGAAARSRSTEPGPRPPALPLTRGRRPPEAQKPEPPSPSSSSSPPTAGSHPEEGHEPGAGRAGPAQEAEACGAGSQLETQPISGSSPSCAGPASDCGAATAEATAASCPAAGAGGAEGDGPRAQEAGVNPDSPASPRQDLAMSGLRGPEGEPQPARPGLAEQSPGAELGPRGPWGGGRPGLQPPRKAGRTITINPRKMAASRGAAENGTEPPPAPAPSPAAPAKKRYPTAEEILVIGGYLSLRRSCLVKAGTTRRKLNITFNESESIFEYPSELALLAEFGAGEDEVLPQPREPQEEEEEEEEEALVSRLEAPGSPVIRRAVRRKPLLVDESCR